MTLTDGIQIAANLATVAAVGYAAQQLKQSATDTRIANSIKLLDQGIQIQQDYREGKTEARAVYSFYYQVFLYKQNDRLLADTYKSLNFSLCRFVADDPRAQQYWEGAQKKYYEPAFVSLIDGIRNSKSCTQ